MFFLKIQNILEDNFNIYVFHFNLVSFWIKIIFILSLIAYPFTIVLGFINSFFLVIICFLLMIFLLALKKKPWNTNRQFKEVDILLKYNKDKDCYNYTFDLERVLKDYNLHSRTDLFDISEEQFRKIRREILKGKYT